MQRHSLYERIMSSLVIFVVLIVLGITAKAFIAPEATISASVNINVPPERVWPYVVEEEGRRTWQLGITTVAPLMEGEMMLGSRSIVMKHIGSKVWEIEEEVFEFDVPKKWEALHTTEAYDEIITITLDESESGTLLSYSSTKIQKGFAGKWFAPFEALSEESALQGTMNSLRDKLAN